MKIIIQRLLIASSLLIVAVQGQNLRSGRSLATSSTIALSENEESSVEQPLATSITDFEDRVKETYRRKGLWNPGDQLVIDYSNIKYNVSNIDVGEPNIVRGDWARIDTFTVRNDASLRKEEVMQRKNSVNRYVSAKVTSGLKIEGETKASVSIPKILLNIGVKLNYEFSLSSTTSKAQWVKQQIQSTFKAVVSPRSVLTAEVSLQEMQVSPDFTADVVMEVEPYYNGKREVFVAINRGGQRCRHSTSLQEAIGASNDPKSRFRIGKNESQVVYKAEGKFEGTTGVDVKIVYSQCPLEGPCDSASKVTTIPLSSLDGGELGDTIVSLS